MKRFYICLGILAAILCVCFWSFNLFSGMSRDMISQLDAIEEAALAQGDSAVLEEMCAEYAQAWEEKEPLLLRVVRHPQLDEIGSLAAELRYLAQDDSYSHLLATVAHIKSNLQKIQGAEAFLG